MKDDFIYKEGTAPWFIIAGIAFVLYPIVILLQRLIPLLADLFFSYLSIDDLLLFDFRFRDFQNIWYFLYFLMTAIASVLIAVGCFTKGRRIRLSGIGFMLLGVFQFLYSVTVNISMVVMLAMENARVTPMLIASYIGRSIMQFLLMLFFLLVGISCLYKLTKKALNIISGILIILYEIGNACTVLLSRLSNLRIMSDLGNARAMLSINFFPCLFALLIATVLIIGCGALFFFAGRTELLPCLDGEEE